MVALTKLDPCMYTIPVKTIIHIIPALCVCHSEEQILCAHAHATKVMVLTVKKAASEHANLRGSNMQNFVQVMQIQPTPA